jgi:hypothetical protein
LALYLEGIDHHPDEDDDEVLYNPRTIREIVPAAFAFGCAVGVEFPALIIPILEQTHPGEVEGIFHDCATPLTEQIEEIRKSPTEMNPDVFLASFQDHLDESQSIESNAAYNLISMGFEYGCVVAYLERPAAVVIRNHYNRNQAHAVASFKTGETVAIPPGPDPNRSLQALAIEIISAYESDILLLS